MTGEFEKQLQKHAFHSQELVSKIIFIDRAFQVVEEAKKEFPIRKLGTKGDWEIINPMEVEKWFMKWFGEQK